MYSKGKKKPRKSAVYADFGDFFVFRGKPILQKNLAPTLSIYKIQDDNKTVILLSKMPCLRGLFNCAIKKLDLKSLRF